MFTGAMQTVKCVLTLKHKPTQLNIPIGRNCWEYILKIRASEAAVAHNSSIARHRHVAHAKAGTLLTTAKL